MQSCKHPQQRSSHRPDHPPQVCHCQEWHRTLAASQLALRQPSPQQTLQQAAPLVMATQQLPGNPHLQRPMSSPAHRLVLGPLLSIAGSKAVRTAQSPCPLPRVMAQQQAQHQSMLSRSRGLQTSTMPAQHRQI